MRTIFVDKVASVAQHSNLGHELRLSDEIPCEEGVLLAVKVRNNKTRYNQLELTSGRMATVTQGDIVVGALGHRSALLGYSGHLPENLAVGEAVQILNTGGVLGICDSANPVVGTPFECEVLGTVVARAECNCYDKMSYDRVRQRASEKLQEQARQQYPETDLDSLSAESPLY